MADNPRAQAAPPLSEGRYRLVEILGIGGMATVYRGFDERLQVARAIKILSPELSHRTKVRARFEAEARTMAAINHPHIVQVFDVGVDGDRSYIVMELVEGGSLVDYVAAHGAMAPRTAVDITIDVLSALDKSHECGIIHRDIKPHNILLTKLGQVRVTDFGIARLRQDDEDALTRTGAVMGTWGFMAPEQRVNAKGVDETADIYAVGATLFGLIKNQTPMDLFAADLDPTLLGGIAEPAAALIRQACRYKREERFPSANAMITAAMEAREALPEPTSEVAIQRSQPAVQSFSQGSLAMSAGGNPPPSRSAHTAVPPTGPVSPNSTFFIDQNTEAESQLDRDGLSSDSGTISSEQEFTTGMIHRRRWPLVLGLILLGGGALATVGIGAFAWPRLVGKPTPPDTISTTDLSPDEPPTPTEEEPAAEEPAAEEAVAEEAIAEEAIAEEPPAEEPATPEAVADASPPDAAVSGPPTRPPTETPTASTPDVALEVVPEEATGTASSTDAAASTTPWEPTLSHTPLTSVSVGGSATFSAQISGSDAYDTVVLYHRPAGSAKWRPQAMFGSAGNFSTTLAVGDEFAGGLDYFIDAQSSTGAGLELKHGSAFNPIRVPAR